MFNPNARLSAVIDLSHDCVEHLDTELDALRELEDALLKVQAALRGGNTQHLAEAAQHQDRLLGELSEVQSRRHNLRQSIASLIGVADSAATISQLIARCPEPDRSRLADRRQQVAQVAVRVDRLMQSNLIVLVHGMQLMEQIWMAITGNQAAGMRYESSGKPGIPPRRAVFQTRC